MVLNIRLHSDNAILRIQLFIDWLRWNIYGTCIPLDGIFFFFISFRSMHRWLALFRLTDDIAFVMKMMKIKWNKGMKHCPRSFDLNIRIRKYIDTHTHFLHSIVLSIEGVSFLFTDDCKRRIIKKKNSTEFLFHLTSSLNFSHVLVFCFVDKTSAKAGG